MRLCHLIHNFWSVDVAKSHPLIMLRNTFLLCFFLSCGVCIVCIIGFFNQLFIGFFVWQAKWGTVMESELQWVWLFLFWNTGLTFEPIALLSICRKEAVFQLFQCVVKTVSSLVEWITTLLRSDINMFWQSFFLSLGLGLTHFHWRSTS